MIEGTRTIVDALLKIDWATFVALLANIGTLIALIPLYIDRRRRKVQHRIEARKKWSELAGTRQVFWETLEKDYETLQTGGSSLPGGFQDLVDRAGFIKGLPVQQGTNLLDLANNLSNSLTGPDKQLWDFVCLVYPQNDPNKKLIDVSHLSAPAFNQFHLPARRELATFWDDLGATVFDYRLVPLKDITKEFFPTHYRTVKLLCYLETALVRWTQHTGLGKKWLFTLGSEWSKKGKRK